MQGGRAALFTLVLVIKCTTQFYCYARPNEHTDVVPVTMVLLFWLTSYVQREKSSTLLNRQPLLPLWLGSSLIGEALLRTHEGVRYGSSLCCSES